MGKIITNNNTVVNAKNSNRQIMKENNNCRVALWHIPYDDRYKDYDTDNSKWFEMSNKFSENEIEKAEKGLRISLSKYKTYTQTKEYSDDSVTEISKYPNGNTVRVNKTSDYVLIDIRDKSGMLVAEKCYNYSSNEGRKTIYKNYVQGDNTFTIVRTFAYDTTKNRSSDIVNYGYTSLESKLTDGCTLEKEYYLLNGKEVKADLNDDFEYCVKDEHGEKIIFKTE